MVLARDQLARLEQMIWERRARLGGEIRDLDAALARVAEATYGACASCGRDIGVERLSVHPTALRCIDCQENHEKTHSRSAAQKS